MFDRLLAAMQNKQWDQIKKSELHMFDKNRNTLLHHAVLDGDVHAAQVLLKNGSQIQIKNKYHETPLDIAINGSQGADILDSFFFPEMSKQQIKNGRAKIAELLRDAAREEGRIERIFNAISNNNGSDIVLAHLDIEDKDIPVLVQALEKKTGYYSINLSNNPLTSSGVKVLVEYLESNTFVCQLNLHATQITATDIGSFLKRLSPDLRLKQFLIDYNSVENLEDLHNLFKYGANLNEVQNEGSFIVHFAAANGHLKTIQFLIASGVDIKRPIKTNRKTALHIAAESHASVISALLDAGVQIDPMDDKGHTPLSRAVQNGCLLAVQILLRRGATSNHMVNRQSILKIAVENRFASIAEELLKHGAKLNQEILESLMTDDLETKKVLDERISQEKELFHAVHSGDPKNLERLLSEGVDIDCIDGNSMTCLQYALKEKNWSLAAWLLFKGANYSGIPEMRGLSETDRQTLMRHGSQFHVGDSKSSVYFLRSKTREVTKADAADYDIYLIYEDLFGRHEEDKAFIENTRPVLQVVEHCLGIKILFDPKKSDTKRANIDTEEGTRGNYCPDSHSIQIAGKTGSYEEVRGTVIHELSHMACELVWSNNRNPYGVATQAERKFKDISATIYEEYQRTKTREKLDSIVIAVFTEYGAERFDRELIVRIPQIIATYGMQYAQILCTKSLGFNQLFKYYQEEVLPAFGKYIQSVDPSHKSIASNKDEKEWYSFARHDSRTVDPDKAELATRIQAAWRGTMVRNTYHRIQFVESSAEILDNFLGSFEQDPNSGTKFTTEISPEVSRIKADLLSKDRFLFAYRDSRKLAEKFSSLSDEIQKHKTKLMQ